MKFLLSVVCLFSLCSCADLYNNIQTAQASPLVQAIEKQAFQIGLNFLQAKASNQSVNTVWGITQGLNAGVNILASANLPSSAVKNIVQSYSDNPQQTQNLSTQLSVLVSQDLSSAQKAAAGLAIASGLQQAATMVSK